MKDHLWCMFRPKKGLLFETVSSGQPDAWTKALNVVDKTRSFLIDKNRRRYLIKVMKEHGWRVVKVRLQEVDDAKQ
jgi:hypothetical protein